MKIIILALLFSSISTFGMTLSTHPGLIDNLFASYEYTKIINKYPSLGADVNILARVPIKIRRKCREFRPAASFIRVRVKYKKPYSLYADSEFYFSATDDGSEIKLCS